MDKLKLKVKLRVQSTKYIQFLLSFIIFLTFYSNEAVAQRKNRVYKDDDGSIVLGLSSGFSIVGKDYTRKLHYDSLDYLSKSGPILQFSVEEFYKANTSVRIQLSWQSFNVKINHWEYIDNGNIYSLNNETAHMNRFYAGGCGTRHLVNNKYIDFYSGFRVGVVWWKTNIQWKAIDFNNQLKKEFYTIKGRPAIGGFTGIRLKFSQNAGINLELNLGAPHYFSFGINRVI